MQLHPSQSMTPRIKMALHHRYNHIARRDNYESFFFFLLIFPGDNQTKTSIISPFSSNVPEHLCNVKQECIHLLCC